MVMCQKYLTSLMGLNVNQHLTLYIQEVVQVGYYTILKDMTNLIDTNTRVTVITLPVWEFGKLQSHIV